MTADPQHHSPGPEKGPVAFVRRWAGILMAAARNWLESQAFIYGAALAFFTVLSIAPVIIVIVALIGFFLGKQTVRDELITQLQAMLGSQATSAVETAIAKLQIESGGLWPKLSAPAAPVVGASTVIASR